MKPLHEQRQAARRGQAAVERTHDGLLLGHYEDDDVIVETVTDILHFVVEEAFDVEPVLVRALVAFVNDTYPASTHQPKRQQFMLHIAEIVREAGLLDWPEEEQTEHGQTQ